MTDLAVIGAGGHTRSSINILLNYFCRSKIGIYDDSFNKNSKPEYINDIQLIGKIDDIQRNQHIFLSVGNNHLREKYFLKFKDQLIKNTIFHLSSIQENDALIGNYNQIFATSFIGSEVRIGINNIINTGVIIEHESVLGNHNHIAIGAKISGRCIIGDRCLIGAGAVIIDNVSICDDVVIGAGSVVISDLNSEGTYVGIPARKIK